jgi:NADH-quinone oxidoreductase subunit L
MPNVVPFIPIAIIILFLPLVGFTFTLLFGKKFKAMYVFELTIITLTLALSVYLAFMRLAYYSAAPAVVAELTWINLGNVPGFGPMTVELGFTIDNLACLMLLVVSLISTLVHYFSIAYMKGDPRYNRYFAYLGIFTFSMLGIVFAHDMLMMYIFWDLVGLSSYLLIGFWFEKKSASDASKKAFVVNRIGDLGMLAGILLLFTTYHTFTFDKIFLAISHGVLPFNSGFWLTVTGVLLFCGAIGKSAQFPLHVWLPDAMEGPTPVSALIHAATMVAAGVYLTTRIFTMLTGDAMLVIATIGALSAFIPATIALTQNDIKKVLAYSTISQLGYMVMALGVGAYSFGFFHLITHAFFKAGLFLGSGSVIYAMHHEQDIRQMGGLRKKLPITYTTFLIFCLAISGIPLTSGFLSKDGILASAMAFGSLTGYNIFVITGFFVALLTAFYMFRLLFLTFHGEPRNKEKYDHAHESPAVMTAPLILLAILSVFAFYTLNPLSAQDGWVLSKWLPVPQSVVPETSRYSFMVRHEEAKPVTVQHAEVKTAPVQHAIIHSEEYTEALHHAHYPAMIISLIVAGLGILFASIMYLKKKINPDKISDSVPLLYKISLNKWYFDEMYDIVFVGGTLAFSRFLAWFDATIVDGIVNGAAAVTRLLSRISGLFDSVVVDGIVNLVATLNGIFGLIIKKIQTGKVQSYLVMAVLSIVILLFIFI